MSDDLRKAAEQNKILEIRHGSHLYGTNTPQSDEDFVGVFLPPIEYVFGLKSVKEVDLGIVSKGQDGKNTSDAVDKKLYEFRKFLTLCLGNNPNILEFLFVDEKNIMFVNEIGQSLLDIRSYFPSKLCVPKFIGYAHAQKHKMIIKKENYTDLLAGHGILEEYDDKHTMSQVYDYEGDNGIFYKKDRGVHIHCGDICFEPGVYVKKAKRKLQERIDKATNRSDLILKHGFDSKFGSHLVRLLIEGRNILQTGELKFPLDDIDMLLDIRNGKRELEQVLETAENLEKEIDELKEKSTIQAKPNYKKVEKFCIETLRNFLEKGEKNEKQH